MSNNNHFRSIHNPLYIIKQHKGENFISGVNYKNNPSKLKEIFYIVSYDILMPLKTLNVQEKFFNEFQPSFSQLNCLVFHFN